MVPSCILTHETSSEEKLSPLMFNAKQCTENISQKWNVFHNPTRQFSAFRFSVSFLSLSDVRFEMHQQRKVSSHTMTYSMGYVCGLWTIDFYTIWPICNCPTHKFQISMKWNRRLYLLWSRFITKFTHWITFCHCASLRLSSLHTETCTHLIEINMCVSQSVIKSSFHTSACRMHL